jgi:hypothetical protein
MCCRILYEDDAGANRRTRALTTALFNKAIIEMMRMEGADAVHKGLRVYADRFDDRKPNDGTNDSGSRLAESLLTAGYHPELVVQSLIESAAVSVLCFKPVEARIANTKHKSATIASI